MSGNPENQSISQVATGIVGLDDILGGGLAANRLYLVEGDPGSGKTTLALQYLLSGVAKGEKTLYVTLSETREELESVATSHGWSLAGIEIIELVPSEVDLEPDNQYTMFKPGDLELGATTKLILSEIDRVKPARMVIDSLTEMRLLAQNALRYRRQVLAFKQFFTGRHCTVLFLDDLTSEVGDLHLQSIAHGVVRLEQLSPEYGAERRRLRVIKLRGRKLRGGYHDFTIGRGGLNVFPRLVAADHQPTDRPQAQLKSGIEGLDELLGGGIEHGTSVLVLGPAGCGKSSLALQFAVSAAMRGERAAIFVFDERLETIHARAAGMRIPLREHLKTGAIRIQSVDPGERSPGEFAMNVRRAAENDGDGSATRVVVIDSLNAYMNAMPEERFLEIQLHELLTYLGHKGVISLIVAAQHGIVGEIRSVVDTSYIADSVIMLRYFEAFGSVKQAISVLKKRSGPHERGIRELKMDSTGLHVGKPLTEFHGVLSGKPRFVGADTALMGPRDE